MTERQKKEVENSEKRYKDKYDSERERESDKEKKQRERERKDGCCVKDRVKETNKTGWRNTEKVIWPLKM